MTISPPTSPPPAPPTSPSQSPSPSPTRCPRLGQRHVMVILLMFGMGVIFTNRVNMSVALVAMVNASAIHSNQEWTSLQNFSIDPSCTLNQTVILAETELSRRVFPYVPKHPHGTFPWTRTTQGLVLSSYFWFYAFPLIPMGAVAHKWNSKTIFGVGVMVPAILSLFLPLAAHLSVYALMTVRALQGLFESITCPSIAVLLGRWLPVNETSMLYNMAMLGALLGTIFGQLSAGSICDKFGWAAIFYFHSIGAAVWIIPWVGLAANSPSLNRWITAAELQLIGNPDGEETAAAVPWKAIIRDQAVWAFIFCMGVRDWLFGTMLSCLPQFLTDILRLSMKETGNLAAIPYVSNLVCPLLCSYAADRVMARECLSRTNTRKLFTICGMWGTAACMFCFSRVGCREAPIIALMTVANVLISLVSGGFMPNAVDLSARYCGVLFSMSNILSTLACILSPIVADELASRGTLKEWGVVFDIGCGMAVIAALFFALCSSGYRRAWDAADKMSDAVDPEEDEEAPLMGRSAEPLEYGSTAET